ncbi:sulfite exporter TauE/SafE family protein [Devosia ginsengisoli]|uniref:Probable membrane transporter protein n=1 Tax=Devosia ginsengisoli TaxID=400770 RepID=A0A5B8LZX6_9HYPH|nr:sulfite exporter TauE/SafE family protein [Devosia ginsengisoli]QDZ12952.1 TSUP family transporter [Devosia ginsengisoli]
MSLLIAAALLLVVFLTSMLSGIFGMAGGLVLLGILLFMLPVGTAIAVQGAIQLVANGSRAWFSRAFIDWRVLAIMTAGLVTAGILLFILRYVPDLATVCIVIGLLPILLWIPQSWLSLDASKPHHAFICGFMGGGINLAVGVAGPTIDMFFIRTPMDRRTIIATKAAAQVVNHAGKIAFYWSATMVLTGWEWGAVALAAPFAIAGTSAGYWVLQRLTDANFKSWTRLLVTAIGIYYLIRGIFLLI